MPPEINNPITTTPHPVNKITPVSKYLAAVLFIILPFIGAYVGYNVAAGTVVQSPTLTNLAIPESQKVETQNFTEQAVDFSEECQYEVWGGASYYISDVDDSIVCFGKIVLEGADAQSLQPLEFTQQISIDGLRNQKSELLSTRLAYDKNSFYFDGKVVFSTDAGDFTITKEASFGTDGLVSIGGTEYSVVYTGLAVATLKAVE